MKAICQSDMITEEIAIASSFGIARTVGVAGVAAFGEAQGGWLLGEGRCWDWGLGS